MLSMSNPMVVHLYVINFKFLYSSIMNVEIVIETPVPCVVVSLEPKKKAPPRRPGMKRRRAAESDNNNAPAIYKVNIQDFLQVF